MLPSASTRTSFLVIERLRASVLGIDAPFYGFAPGLMGARRVLKPARRRGCGGGSRCGDRCGVGSCLWTVVLRVFSLLGSSWGSRCAVLWIRPRPYGRTPRP
jgi:hypothetical protein